MCNCGYCQRSERITTLFKEYPFKTEDRKWLTEMFNLLFRTEVDLDYKNRILHGDWPSSVEQLTRALGIAKEKRNEVTH